MILENWIDYFNSKSENNSNYLDVSDMHIGDDVATNNFFQSEKDKMVQLLQPQQSFTLLDLGCCAGVCLGLLKDYYGKTIGVDLAEGPLAIAKGRLPRTQFILDDITDPTYLGTDMAEHILTYGVLQFLSDQQLAGYINTLYKITKPGGRVVVMRTPNKDYYEPYQAYRNNRNITRKTISDEKLQWNWVSPAYVRELCVGKFDYISILPTTGIGYPLQGFFDFVLIKK